jgi:hypothetical protein
VSYDILSYLYSLYYMLLLSSHLRLTHTISFSSQGFHINNVCICILNEPCFMFHLPHSLTQQRSGFEDKVVRVGFVVHEVAVGQVFLRELLLPSIVIPPTVHSHIPSMPPTLYYLDQGCPCRGLRGCIMRPAVTFVNYTHTVKSGNNSGVMVPLMVIVLTCGLPTSPQ